jgi:hypothetical protein
MNYKELFQTTKDQLTSAGAQLLREDHQSNLTEGERTYYTEDENFSMPDDWYDLFSTINGLEFNWNIPAKEADQGLAGFFRFPDIGNFIANKTEDKLWVDWYEKEDIEEMKKHHILEMIEGNDAYITVKFGEDGSYKLYFADGENINHGGSKELPEIPLTLKQYMEVVAGYYGVYPVRYHLHKKDFYTQPEKYISEYESLKQLIPGFDPPKIDPFADRA